MSNQILKVIAALMLVGSMILIAVAYQMGKPPQITDQEMKPIVSLPETGIRVIKAAHLIKSGQILQESDVILDSVNSRPADAFDTKTEVLGRRAIADINPGMPLLHSHLATGNILAQSLKENERAIAVKVDEFIGVGGFIEPGDFVDVIAFIRADNNDIKEPQAVVALHSIRVLAYGEVIPSPEEDKSKPGEEVKGKTGRSTAILALAEEQTSLLSLLENAAVLRLALRPSSNDKATEGENKAYSVALSDVLASQENTAKSNSRQTYSSNTNNFQPKKSQGPMVEIYHGTNVEQIQYP